jgi:hypothetical protein
LRVCPQSSAGRRSATASHNLALKHTRGQAFYLLWNQSRQGGLDLQNAAPARKEPPEEEAAVIANV